MWTTTKAIDFCAGHRLLNYDGKCAHVHGHNLRAEIEVTSANLNTSGMVIDFGLIKDAVKTWIDDRWDHGFLVNQFDYPMLEFLKTNGQKHFVLDTATVELAYGHHAGAYTGNGIAMCNPTMENLAKVLKLATQNLFDDSHLEFGVRLYESENGWVDV